MFASLRYRLIASYVAVIFLCLFLAGSAFVLLLREYQQRIRMDQLADLSFPISFNVRGVRDGRRDARAGHPDRPPAQRVGRRAHHPDRPRRDRARGHRRRCSTATTISLPSRGASGAADSFRPYYAIDEGGILMVAPSFRSPGSGVRASNYVVDPGDPPGQRRPGLDGARPQPGLRRRDQPARLGPGRALPDPARSPGRSCR